MRTVATLSLVALALAGCRSDGGIDRRDCGHSMLFATTRVWTQTERDAGATVATLASVPGALARAFPESWRNVEATNGLYVEGRAPR